MYSLINALARGENFSARNFTNSMGIGAGGEFGKIFNRAMHGVGGGIQDILDKLQERFPHAKVNEKEVPAGIEESKAAAEDDGDKTSDKINLGSSLLQNMLGDGNLAKMIEDAIAGFLEGGENSGMMAMNGAYVQRSVTITVTTLRYTEMQRSQENGDILAASELQTSLRDKIGEMIQQLFGAGSRGEESESETSGDAGNDGDSVPSRNRTQWGSGAVSMWSMELFYSMTAIQGQGAFGTGSGSGEASGYNVSGSFSRFSASYGSFSALTSNRLPSLLSQFMGGGSESGGGLSGFLEEALSGFGLSGGSYRQTSEGFSFKVSQSRNLIAELMELYGDRIGQNNAAAAEAAEEEPAEAVAAAG